MNIFLILAIALCLTALGCKSKAQDLQRSLSDAPIPEVIEPVHRSTDAHTKPVDGELLVVLENDADIKQIIAGLERQDGVTFIKMLMDVEDARIAHLRVPVGKEKSYISILSSMQGIKYVEPNMRGTFAGPPESNPEGNPTIQKSRKQPEAAKKGLPADKIVGLWEVKNDYYMAVYEIKKYKDKYVGLLHYYNDGKTEVEGDGSEKYYFLDNVLYTQGKYDHGKMYMPDGSEYAVEFVLKGENQLVASMIVQGEAYTELWNRKTLN